MMKACILFILLSPMFVFASLSLNLGIDVSATNVSSVEIHPNFFSEMFYDLEISKYFGIYPAFKLGLSARGLSLGVKAGILLNLENLRLRTGFGAVVNAPNLGINGYSFFRLEFPKSASLMNLQVDYFPALLVNVNFYPNLSIGSSISLGLDLLPKREITSSLPKEVKRCGEVYCTFEDSFRMLEDIDVYVEGGYKSGNMIIFKEPIVEISKPPERVIVVNLRRINTILQSAFLEENIAYVGSNELEVIFERSPLFKILDSEISGDEAKVFFKDSKLVVLSDNPRLINGVTILNPTIRYMKKTLKLKGEFYIPLKFAIIPKLPDGFYISKAPKQDEKFIAFGLCKTPVILTYRDGNFVYTLEGKDYIVPGKDWTVFDIEDYLKGLYTKGDEISRMLSTSLPFDVEVEGRNVDLIMYKDGRITGSIKDEAVVEHYVPRLTPDIVFLVSQSQSESPFKPKVRLMEGVKLKVYELPPGKDVDLKFKCFKSGESLLGKLVEVIGEDGKTYKLKVINSQPLRFPESGSFDLKLKLAHPVITTEVYKSETKAAIFPEIPNVLVGDVGEATLKPASETVNFETVMGSVGISVRDGNYRILEPATKIGVYKVLVKDVEGLACELKPDSKAILLPKDPVLKVLLKPFTAGSETSQGTNLLTDVFGNAIENIKFSASSSEVSIGFDGKMYHLNGFIKAGKINLTLEGEAIYESFKIPVEVTVNAYVTPSNPAKLALKLGDSIKSDVAIAPGQHVLDVVALDRFENVSEEFKVKVDVSGESTQIRIVKEYDSKVLEMRIPVVRTPKRVNVKVERRILTDVDLELRAFDEYGEVEATFKYNVDGFLLDDPVVPVQGTHTLIVEAIPKLPENFVVIGASPVKSDPVVLGPPTYDQVLKGSKPFFYILEGEKVVTAGVHDDLLYVVVESGRGNNVTMTLYKISEKGYSKVFSGRKIVVKKHPIKGWLYILSDGQLYFYKGKLHLLRSGVDAFDIDEHGKLWILSEGKIFIENEYLTDVDKDRIWEDIKVCGGKWLIYGSGKIYHDGIEFYGEKPSWKPDCSAFVYTRDGLIQSQYGETLTEGVSVLNWLSVKSFIFLKNDGVYIWQDGKVKKLGDWIYAVPFPESGGIILNVVERGI